MTDVKGIMSGPGDKQSLLPTLTVKQVEDLIQRKVIVKGMFPKVKACVSALKAGVHKTHIIGANIPHALLLEIFTTRGIGTQIVLS
jgi:acetylglutamate kinase